MSECIKTVCQQCNGPIEFEKTALGRGRSLAIQCPHCGHPTIIARKGISLLKIVAVLLVPCVGLAICFAMLIHKISDSSGGFLTAQLKSSGDTWITNNIFRQGNIDVRIENVKIGSVLQQNELNDGVTPSANLLGITIALKNTSQNIKMDFHTWRATSEADFLTAARLVDDNGNVYKTIIFSPPPYNYLDERSIYPQDQIQDLVLFEVPVENLKWLHLTLPEGNFGRDGTINFQIEKSAYR